MEIKCTDCIYFMQHFVQDKVCFRPIPYQGHCTNKKENGRFRKTDKPCECFVMRDENKEKEEQLKNAAEYLKYISRHLKDLKDLLKVTLK